MSHEHRRDTAYSLGQFIAPCKVFLMIYALIWSFAAWGQPAKVAQTKKASKSQQNVKIARGGKVIEFQQLKLEGTVQRPSAAYLMQRRRLKFKGLVPKKSFVSKIKKSVTKPPF